ncbi:RNA-binding protein 34 isoform X2 [Lingula anatina]|uniref:RNA-binding protein 34 isoform X2 n=1 Tax=Lingula anatina TaxID=7574 RepID=A0A1S3HHQ1_LINAN|nr:RNA-binding protein 34 isoform X2 [Lingula anatina]|eukprot:XP_013385011.1 RNA-binding protein 34 isoform X2 [Lingula anatina]
MLSFVFMVKMLSGYSVGQLSSLISGDNGGKKKKKKDKSAALFENSPTCDKKKGLFTSNTLTMKKEDNFTVTVKTSTITAQKAKLFEVESKDTDTQPNRDVKFVKDKIKEAKTVQETTNVTRKVHDNPLHVSLHGGRDSTKSSKSKKRKLDDDEPQTVKKRNKYKPDKQKDSKTIFVGNLPAKIKKKALEKMFKKYGNIESIRLRNAVSSDPKVSKKLAVIKKDFHPNKKNINAYIVFEECEQAQNALKCNGEEVEGNHIRVDLSSAAKEHDNRRSIFLGNLPFDINEDEVWEEFEDCGIIENVRIVRDGKTGIGKGFGYILFKSPDSVSLALRLKNKQLKGREVRISCCVKQEKVLRVSKEKKRKIVKNPQGHSNSNILFKSIQGKNLDVKDKQAKMKQKGKKKKHHLLNKQKKVVADILLGNKAYKDRKPFSSKKKIYGKGYHNVMSAQKRILKKAKKQKK